MNPSLHAPQKNHYDVVIIGGAMMGSSAAWFLSSNPDFDGTILVVERDQTYAQTSTTATNSCMRQQFSNEINVRISQFAADYVKNFSRYMGDDPRVPNLDIQNFGYLYLAQDEAFDHELREAQKLQAACGAGTRYMSTQQIQAAYPFYQLDDIVGGTHNLVDEGYFDGNTLFDWWKRGAREKGVEYLSNEVVALEKNAAGSRIERVVLKSGATVSCGHVINAAGPRAALCAEMAGVDLPVEPRKRHTFIFAAERPLSCDLPLTVDPSGMHMRSEGAYYMAGCPPDIDPAVAYDDFIEDHDMWEDKVWPLIATRVPQFEAVKLINSWVGHYAYNRLDQNAIIGPHTKVENFLFMNGFSGHGFQQAPAMGRGIAEWITYGAYRSLDLAAFAFDRVETNTKFSERAVI
jgi:glycine/D-amino acid oxidase-like deaminating enzyme